MGIKLWCICRHATNVKVHALNARIEAIQSLVITEKVWLEKFNFGNMSTVISIMYLIKK